MKASSAPAGRGKAPRERRLSWKLRIKLDRAAGEASLLDPPSSDDEDAAPELVAEANSIEKICDARTQGGGARLALGGTGPQQYLCKFKGRAHVHARWLTAEEIAVDGRLSLQRLQHFDRKRADGQLEPYNSDVCVVERVIAVRGGGAPTPPPPPAAKKPRAGGSDDVDMDDAMEEDDDDDDDDGEAALARFNAAARATQAAAAPAAASSAAPSEKLYLVKWKGCQYDACTWEAAAVAGAAAVGAFEAREEKVARRDAAPAPSEKAAAVDWKEVPEGLFPTERTLRDYQVEGLRWLRYNFTKGRGAILGDEMGLGKTAQSVTLLQCLRSLHGVSGPFLIVVPLSTLPHWQRELAEWTDLHSVIFHGNKAARDMIAIHEWARAGAALNARGAPSAAALATPKFDVVVTTYEMLVTAEALFLKVANWGYLVVDEAHRLKNRESRALRTLRQLPVGGRLALTGTPLQNHVSELWSILNFLDSDAFPQMEDFIARFGDMRNAAQVTALTEAIRPYLLRREKGDVELGLVPMEETLIFVEITAFQKRCYKVGGRSASPRPPARPPAQHSLFSPYTHPTPLPPLLRRSSSRTARCSSAAPRRRCAARRSTTSRCSSATAATTRS